MKYSKLPIFLEIIWLILSIVCFVLALQNKFYSSGDKFTTLLVFALASFLLYIIRRNRRMANRADKD